MTTENDLPAEVRRQDEEAELQIAAQLSELRTDTGTAREEICPRKCEGRTRKPNSRSLRSYPSCARMITDEDAGPPDDVERSQRADPQAEKKS